MYPPPLSRIVDNYRNSDFNNSWQKMFSCDLLSCILGFALVILVIYWRYDSKRKSNLPPGPTGLPFVGYLPLVTRMPQKKFALLSQKYGKIFPVHLGKEWWIVLNDFQSVKEAFNNSAVLDRSQEVFTFFPDGLGLLSQNGAEWMEQRRYCIRALKDIGIGTASWEIILEEEVDDFVKFLESQNCRSVDISESLRSSMSNNIVSILIGQRLMVGDPKRTLVNEAVESIIRLMSSARTPSFFPKQIKFLSELGLTWYTKDLRNIKKLSAFMWSEVTQRKSASSLDRNEDIFLDRYLTEIDNARQCGNTTYFTEKNLVAHSQVLVLAGTETGATSLLWLLLAMAAYDDVQKKVQDEIDRVLGTDGKLKWSDRSKLPYTYATIMESQRWRTVTPFGIPHRTSENTTIGGYDIPKGMNVMPNFDAFHNDPDYWKDPEVFVPERFLNDDGSLITRKPDSYAPFSTGKRSCPGENIALIEIFHYFTTILKKFHVRTVDGKPPRLDGKVEASFQPVRQKLRFLPRDY